MDVKHDHLKCPRSRTHRSCAKRRRRRCKFNIMGRERRACVGPSLPGSASTLPPLISSGEARVWSRRKPSPTRFSRRQRSSKTRALSSFWLLRVKVIDIPEPWGPCSASSTWCSSSTFYSGYVVLRSAAIPVCVRVKNSFFLWATFFDA